MSDQPAVTIKHRTNPNGDQFYEQFVVYQGHTFYSRNFLLVDNTPHGRAQVAAAFMQRLRRFPSTVVSDFYPTPPGFVEALQEPPPAAKHRPIHGGRADLVEFAKQGAPPARRPFSIVGGNDAA